MGGAILKAIGLRDGEWRIALPAFGVFFLLIAGHTVIETARDALLLTRLPPTVFGALYVASAIAVFFMSRLVTRASERFGLKRALGGALGVASLFGGAVFAVPTSRATVFLLYVGSTLVGAVIVPLFWNLLASTLTVAQGRRLLGPIAAAGVVGGAIGSLTAATLLSLVHVKTLLIFAAVPFTTAAVLVARMRVDDPSTPTTPALGTLGAARAMKEEPFLRMIALLVISSTVAMFALDYFFKWSVARNVPHAEVARFIARYYAVLNGAALITQLLIGGAVVRRIGVGGTLLVSPLVLLFGGSASLLAGGALLAVLVLKGVDGATRTPLHRVTMEMLYLPMSTRVRVRAKPYIDGSLVRVSQGVVGALLFGLAAVSWLTPRTLGVIVVGSGATWLVVALATRRAYFGLLRRALAGGTASSDSTIDPLDFENAEALVASLADDEPLIVIGAMEALERRGRGRLVPALVLLHPDGDVLIRALGIFARSRREDWVQIARRLLTDPRDGVRMAAARTLAMHGRLETADLAGDTNARVRGYAALHVALRSDPADALDDPSVQKVLRDSDPDADELRLGLVDAIADLPAQAPVSRLLLALEARAGSSREWIESLARAARSQGATAMIPLLVSSMVRFDVRETVVMALVSFGETAMEEIWATLLDHSRARSLRAQMPNALSRFGTPEAADRLLTCIETEEDGLVRFKAIRALGRLVAEFHVKIDRPRAERQALANLTEYFRLLGLRATFDSEHDLLHVGTDAHGVATRLLVRLVDDKLQQSLERTFRLLKIAYPREDIHRVHIALRSDDRRARANATEFLDTLLRLGDQRRLRELLLLVADDLSPGDRVARARAVLGLTPAKAQEDVLASMLEDPDSAIATLAALRSSTLPHLEALNA